jgi:hypothetical protein
LINFVASYVSETAVSAECTESVRLCGSDIFESIAMSGNSYAMAPDYKSSVTDWPGHVAKD